MAYVNAGKKALPAAGGEQAGEAAPAEETVENEKTS